MTFQDQILLAILSAAPDRLTPVLIFVGGVIASITTYLIAHRANTGEGEQQRLKTLWEESTGMRHDLRDQVEALQARLTKLEERNDLIEQRNAALEEQILALKTEGAKLQWLIDGLIDKRKEQHG